MPGAGPAGGGETGGGVVDVGSKAIRQSFQGMQARLEPLLVLLSLTKMTASIISKPIVSLAPISFSFHPPPPPQKNSSSCVRAELCVCEMAAI